MDVQLGRGWSAPFTGYTWRAFQAFVALASAWYSSDGFSRPLIEDAMRATVRTLQRSELAAARLAIYGVGNETAMLGLWPRIKPERLAVESELKKITRADIGRPEFSDVREHVLDVTTERVLDVLESPDGFNGDKFESI